MPDADMDDQTARYRQPGRMALTPELVGLTIRPEPDLGPEPGWTHLEEHEVDDLATRYARECGDDQLWLFAYGSLIWKPDFDAIGQMRASAYGWHRSFCLRMTRWRGSPEQNGLMMALERGGRCDGVIYRLPDHDRIDQLRRLLMREVRFHQNTGMIRWIRVHTAQGARRALVFWAGPTGDRVASRLPPDQVAHVLARACGPIGSCAEYLYNTVLHLREFGINDRNLWRLQALVAAEIRAIHGDPI